MSSFSSSPAEFLKKYSINVKVLEVKMDSGEESPAVALVVERLCLKCFDNMEFPVDESFGVSIMIKWQDLGVAIRTLMQGKLLLRMEPQRMYYSNCQRCADREKQH